MSLRRGQHGPAIAAEGGYERRPAEVKPRRGPAPLGLSRWRHGGKVCGDARGAWLRPPSGSVVECPKCGSSRVDHEAPGPGQGGLYSFRCHACGHEESGICDPGRVDRGPTPGPEPSPEIDTPCCGRQPSPKIDAPCSVCGRPGRVQNLPGVPVSGCYCEEHAPTFVLKPFSVLLVLAAVALAAWLIWVLLW